MIPPDAHLEDAPDELLDLLARSDVVVLAAPLTRETERERQTIVS
jgi:phosphoglycerate dehydrogenase-like enzyme